MDADHTTIAAEALLAELVYELLDAQVDTLLLTAEPLDGAVWSAHVDYLRGLQRVGRETLARLGRSGRPVPPPVAAASTIEFGVDRYRAQRLA